MTLHRNVSEILKGSLPYLASGIVNSAAPFVVSLFVSRYLGREALGVFSVCFALVLAGILVSDLGLNSLIMREFAGTRQPTSMDLRTLLFVRTFASTIAGVGVIIVATFFISSTDLLLLGSTAFVLIVLRSVAGTLENVMKARLYRAAYAAVMIASSAAHVLLVYLVLSSGSRIASVFLTMAGVETAKTLLLMWIGRQELKPPAHVSPLSGQALGLLLQQGLPFALIGILTLINERSALFFLSKIWGNGEAGIYAAADRFLTIGTLIDSSLFASAFPILSLFRGDSHFHRVTRQTLSITFSVGVVGALILIIGSPLLIGLSFRYPESIGLLRILSLSLPALLWNSIIRIALFSSCREKSVATVFGVACALNIGLNIILVPRFASTGAALVAVFTEYFMSAMYGFLYLRSMLHDLGPVHQGIGKAVSGANS